MKGSPLRPVSLFFLLTFLLVPICVSAQARSSINGFVYGPQRERLADIRVELQTDLGTMVGYTKTDSSGRFSFSNVPFGRLSVRVMPTNTDFAGQTQDIDVGSVGARGQQIPDNVQLDFYLRPRNEPTKVVTGVLVAQDVPTEAKKTYEAAVSQLDKNQIPEGIEQLKKALEVFPDYYLANERLAEEYSKQGKWAEAYPAYKKAVAVNSRSYPALHGLAYAAYYLKKYDEAIDAASRAVVENKNSASAYFVLGVAQRSSKQFDAAEKSLLSAKKLDKGQTPEISWNLALLYTHNLKKYQLAADELELYLKESPDAPNIESVKKVIAMLRQDKPPS
jgi:Tfp pilus assembly protein PilF